MQKLRTLSQAKRRQIAVKMGGGSQSVYLKKQQKTLGNFRSFHVEEKPEVSRSDSLNVNGAMDSNNAMLKTEPCNNHLTANYGPSGSFF